MSSTIEELLMAAEYILSHGNMRVMLCERGIRTFETYTRNTFDINAIPVLKQLSHLPDHCRSESCHRQMGICRERRRWRRLRRGRMGLILEVHQDPENAASDGRQSLKPERFAALVEKVTQARARREPQPYPNGRRYEPVFI